MPKLADMLKSECRISERDGLEQLLSPKDQKTESNYFRSTYFNHA